MYRSIMIAFVAALVAACGPMPASPALDPQTCCACLVDAHNGPEAGTCYIAQPATVRQGRDAVVAECVGVLDRGDTPARPDTQDCRQQCVDECPGVFDGGPQ